MRALPRRFTNALPEQRPGTRYGQNGLQDAHSEHSLTLGLGFEVFGLGFQLLGLGCDVLGLGFSVLGPGFEVLGHPKLPRFWVTQGPKSRKAASQLRGLVSKGRSLVSELRNLVFEVRSLTTKIPKGPKVTL